MTELTTNESYKTEMKKKEVRFKDWLENKAKLDGVICNLANLFVYFVVSCFNCF